MPGRDRLFNQRLAFFRREELKFVCGRVKSWRNIGILAQQTGKRPAVHQLVLELRSVDETVDAVNVFTADQVRQLKYNPNHQRAISFHRTLSNKCASTKEYIGN